VPTSFSLSHPVTRTTVCCRGGNHDVEFCLELSIPYLSFLKTSDHCHLLGLARNVTLGDDVDGRWTLDFDVPPNDLGADPLSRLVSLNGFGVTAQVTYLLERGHTRLTDNSTHLNSTNHRENSL
jgi:hypothetical protein